MKESYSADEVKEIINIIVDEADDSIEDAYKEGYKQSQVELQPEVEYWKTKAEATRSSFQNSVYSGALGFGLGVIVTSVTLILLKN